MVSEVLLQALWVLDAWYSTGRTSFPTSGLLGTKAIRAQMGAVYAQFCSWWTFPWPALSQQWGRRGAPRVPLPLGLRASPAQLEAAGEG